MAIIQIKRGLQANVERLELAQGEMALAKDTGNLYIGTETGKVLVNPTGGTADVAVRLKNPQPFSITGDGAANAVQFDGTGAVSLALALAEMPGLQPGTYTRLSVDVKGRVTMGGQLRVSDLPDVPYSKVTGLGSAALLDTGVTAGKVVVVGENGKLPDSLMPALAVSDTYEAASESAMLALQAQKGDICIRTDEGKSYILSESPAANVENWKWLKTPDCAVVSVNGMTGAVSLAASDVEAVPNSRKINGKSLAADVTLNAQDVNARSSDWTPTASDVGAEPLIRNALADTSVADADTMPFTDASASMATKKITFANLKSVLKSYFDGLYNKYVHPAYPENAKGLYKIASDTTGHVSEATAVTKADITALGIPEQDTVYVLPAATVTQLGGVKVGAGLSMDGDVMSVGTIDGGSF